MVELTREQRDRLRAEIVALGLPAAVRTTAALALPGLAPDPNQADVHRLAALLPDEAAGDDRLDELVRLMLREAAQGSTLAGMLDLPHSILGEDASGALSQLEAALDLNRTPDRALLDAYETRLLAVLDCPEEGGGRESCVLELECGAFVRAAELADAADDPRVGAWWDRAEAFLSQLEERGLSLPEDQGTRIRRRAAWCLETVELSGIRAFRELTWNTRGSARCGQWLFLLGENGTGKTALLQAIALAAGDAGMTGDLVRACHPRSPVLRFDAESGSVTLRARAPEDRQPPRVDLHWVQADGGIRRATARARAAWQAPFLVAYGARRGSTLGGLDAEMDLAADRGVRTLFDEKAVLVRASDWLLGLKARADDPGNPRRDRDGAFLQVVRETLVALLPGVAQLEISTETRHWFVLGDPTPDPPPSADGIPEPVAMRKVPLEALSDGYITTASWVIDMIARWAERARNLEYVVQGNFAQQMTGVALVDELDLHLHPRWQWELVDRLRTTFPRMTFVVTTHNPVTALNARPGEVYVLRWQLDENNTRTGQVELAPMDVPSGTDVGTLLRSPAFAGTPTISRAALQRIEEYQRAVLEGNPEQISRLQQGLDRPLEELLSEERRRLLFQFAAEQAMKPTVDYSHLMGELPAEYDDPGEDYSYLMDEGPAVGAELAADDSSTAPAS